MFVVSRVSYSAIIPRLVRVCVRSALVRRSFARSLVLFGFP